MPRRSLPAWIATGPAARRLDLVSVWLASVLLSACGSHSSPRERLGELRSIELGQDALHSSTQEQTRERFTLHDDGRAQWDDLDGHSSRYADIGVETFRGVAANVDRAEIWVMEPEYNGEAALEEGDSFIRYTLRASFRGDAVEIAWDGGNGPAALTSLKRELQRIQRSAQWRDSP